MTGLIAFGLALSPSFQRPNLFSSSQHEKMGGRSTTFGTTKGGRVFRRRWAWSDV